MSAGTAPLSRLLPRSQPATGRGLLRLPLGAGVGAGAPGLRRGRLHEGCGPSRHLWALLLAGAEAAGQGLAPPVLWIQPGWAGARLYPPAMAGICPPGALVFVTCTREADLLWTAEEALRAGAVGLVVADLPAPPGLTAVRRLHLAAEAGAEAGAGAGRVPLGLVLTPGEGGAPGVESRWHMAPRPTGGGSGCWRLERVRERGAGPAGWDVTRDAGGRWALAG